MLTYVQRMHGHDALCVRDSLAGIGTQMQVLTVSMKLTAGKVLPKDALCALTS